MATGWTFKDSGGVDIDFDQAFAPRDGYTATAATGFSVAGQDFADRYRASTSTSDRIGIATKFYRGAVAAENDFSVIFRRKLAVLTFAGGGTVNSGEYVTFTATAVGHSLHYEWRKNGSPISGAPDSSSYSFYASEGDAGNYSCRVYNSFSEEYTATISLSINPPANPPVPSISGPSTAARSAGITIYFGASDADGDMTTYTVRHTGYGAINPGGEGAAVPNSSSFSDSFTYYIPPSTPLGSAEFKIEVSDSEGNTVSAWHYCTITA